MRSMNEKALVQSCKISVSILNSGFGNCALFLKNCFVLEFSDKDGSAGEGLSCSSVLGLC